MGSEMCIRDSSRDEPSHFSWSSSIFVITDKSASIRLTGSYFPPIPISRIAISRSSFEKISKAARVAKSKYVRRVLFLILSIFSKDLIISSSEDEILLILILSLNSIK